MMVDPTVEDEKEKKPVAPRRSFTRRVTPTLYSVSKGKSRDEKLDGTLGTDGGIVFYP